ncbi:hypothetical protein T07_4129 [Trichinella nelsoni]|uniref:Uncharacterized protein n=1 Tax=Trichinella nelsoni TaxID=6336 RepID=A0A0V0SLJ5_9BILA|nr:hypothetical protein T07_4129 [Trichinella nelsoni]
MATAPERNADKTCVGVELKTKVTKVFNILTIKINFTSTLRLYHTAVLHYGLTIRFLNRANYNS